MVSPTSRLSNASVESSEAADLDGAVLAGALSLVDLAGSENAETQARLGNTEGRWKHQQELADPIRVIKALAAAKGKDVHVRFRQQADAHFTAVFGWKLQDCRHRLRDPCSSTLGRDAEHT